MVGFSVATWNINSVRLRLSMVLDYLKEHQPDILCLQEIKCINDSFPRKAFMEAGYPYLAINGQKSYNGVAIISRLPLLQVYQQQFCQIVDSRHIAASFRVGTQNILLHNFYVPAGGEDPDLENNPKFRHKIDFLYEMKEFLHNIRVQQKDFKNFSTILLGDLNIAPFPDDVWSHKHMQNIISHTKLERELLIHVMEHGEWVDIMRQMWPQPEKLYSWWSYRAKDYKKSNKGRRLDHIWTSKDLQEQVKDIHIHHEARGFERPSDHVPIKAFFMAKGTVS